MRLCRSTFSVSAFQADQLFAKRERIELELGALDALVGAERGRASWSDVGVEWSRGRTWAAGVAGRPVTGGVMVTGGATGGWAAAMAASRVPPCQVLVRTKSCSMLTLLTVTLTVWMTVSLRLAMI